MAFEFLNPAQNVGPGVDKNRPQKKRFFLFFELYFRKFGKLMYSNLLYFFTLIPLLAIAFAGFFLLPVFNLAGAVVALALIGPSTSAFVFLLREISLGRPVFIWHDFWQCFQKNFKLSLSFSAIDAVLITLVAYPLYYALNLSSHGTLEYVFLVLYAAVAVFFLMIHYYVYLMLVTLDLRVSKILKNSAILALVGLKTNLITTFFVLLLIVLPIAVLPFGFWFSALIILGPLFYTSLVCFIAVFNSFPKIKKFVIDPYYEKHPAERKNNPLASYEEEEKEDDRIFTDLGTLEPKAKTTSGQRTDNNKKTLS